MFTFVVAVSVACLLLAASGAFYGYLAVKSDETGGDATAFIGFIVGTVVWVISAAVGLVGLIGLVIAANRMFG